MKDKRFWFGIGLSALWVAFAVAMLCTQERPTKLNEWGDAFAGFFAPLAIFWLVLGYLQQGEELRQSSKALHLQAEELKNSVEQQSQLVEVSRKQLEQQAESQKEERARRLAEYQPIFSLMNERSSVGVNFGEFVLRVSNAGGTATQIHFTVEPDKAVRLEPLFNRLGKDETGTLSITFPVGVPTVLSIHYADLLGQKHRGDADLLVAGSLRHSPVFQRLLDTL